MLGTAARQPASVTVAGRSEENHGNGSANWIAPVGRDGLARLIAIICKDDDDRLPEALSDAATGRWRDLTARPQPLPDKSWGQRQYRFIM